MTHGRDHLIVFGSKLNSLTGVGANPFSPEHYGAADCIWVWACAAKKDDGQICLTAWFRGQEPTGKKETKGGK